MRPETRPNKVALSVAHPIWALGQHNGAAQKVLGAWPVHPGVLRRCRVSGSGFTREAGGLRAGRFGG